MAANTDLCNFQRPPESVIFVFASAGKACTRPGTMPLYKCGTFIFTVIIESKRFASHE